MGDASLRFRINSGGIGDSSSMRSRYGAVRAGDAHPGGTIMTRGGFCIFIKCLPRYFRKAYMRCTLS